MYMYLAINPGGQGKRWDQKLGHGHSLMAGIDSIGKLILELWKGHGWANCKAWANISAG